MTKGLERRHVVEDHTRAMPREELDRLFTRRDVSLRDRALWRLLYESGARANEVLNLNVEDIDLESKRAYTVRKGGDRDVLHFQTKSARLLPKVIGGRTSGPLFLAETVPAGARAPAALDRDPTTGRARLSYRRAAEVFSAAAPGRTLPALRHAAITGLAEAGAPAALDGQVQARIPAHPPALRPAQRRRRRPANRRARPWPSPLKCALSRMRVWTSPP